MPNDERLIPGSIPGAPTFGPAQDAPRPAITIPNPGIFLEELGSTGDVEPRQPRRRRRRRSSTQQAREASRVEQDRERADRLQAALAFARGRSTPVAQQQSPFDLDGEGAPAFLNEVDNARIRS